MNLLTTIEVFVKVADLGSYTLAAETLNLSRTATSKSVMDLEDHLGVRLINRTTRRLSLTEAGSNFLERARVILHLIDDAEREAANLTSLPKGRLRVNAPMSFGIRHISPALGSYLEAYPGVSVELTLNDRLVDLVDEGFDVAIRIGRLADSSLVARKLAPCRLVVCAAPTYLERRGMPRVPEDLTRHDCLIYSYASDRDDWHFVGPDGPTTIRIGGRLNSNNGDAVVQAALAGLGIILQPTFIVGPEIREGRLVPLLPDHRPADLGIYALYPQNRYVSAKVRTFIDHMNRLFGDRPYWEPDGIE